MSGVDIPDEAMKPRRVNPATVLLAMVIVALGIGLLWFGLKKDAAKMTVEQRMEVQANIFVLPVEEQIPKWRQYAADTNAPVELRAEALTQLGLLGDQAEGVKLATAALKDPSHALRGTAAQVLAHFGKASESAKPALLEALKESDDSDRRQILWTLVELGEPSVFDQAMDSYKVGEITTVTRLAGGRAFDPLKITRLVSLDQLASRATDDSSAVRQLVATILSENADKKFTDVLIKLVQDPEVVVAREAAVGLGKIGDDKARGPLVEALKKADKDNRSKFLEALRNGIGGEGLVLALDTVVDEPESRRWFQMKQLFDMMRTIADPRVGDALIDWVKRKQPGVHWETEAGIVLAMVGDVRGAKYIAKRMPMENKDIYDKEKFWQADAGGHLSKNDNARIEGARMLADLAVMHPDKHAELKEMAEEAVIEWSTGRIQPHANALRFLATVDSERGEQLIRDWAFPNTPLPEEGAQPPFPRDFETAQSALRYIGRMKEAQDKLLNQFDRKEEAKMDITQQGLMGAGIAMLGMALRAVAYGAAQGIAEAGWQDEKVNDELIEFIEDKTWHEEARTAACEALAWTGTDEVFGKVVEKVGTFAASSDPKDQFIGACYATTLTNRPVPSAINLMVDLLKPELELGVRVALGRAIGVTGLSSAPEATEKLFAMLENPELRNAAALALIMGGDESTAARAVATYGTGDIQANQLALNALKDSWYRAFGYWSDRDLDSGNIARWVKNAEAIRRVKIGDAPQEWATQRLRSQFDNLVYDNGPHSETRVVLRYRLIQMAKSDAEKRKDAIQVLRFMGAQGALLALKGEEGELGQLAQEAYHELMNPALVAKEDLSHLQEEEK